MVFDNRKIYFTNGIADATDSCTRTVFNWRRRGIVPPPDGEIAGRPFWTGKTLNRDLLKLDDSEAA